MAAKAPTPSGRRWEIAGSAARREDDLSESGLDREVVDVRAADLARSQIHATAAGHQVVSADDDRARRQVDEGTTRCTHEARPAPAVAGRRRPVESRFDPAEGFGQDSGLPYDPVGQAPHVALDARKPVAEEGEATGEDEGEAEEASRELVRNLLDHPAGMGGAPIAEEDEHQAERDGNGAHDQQRALDLGARGTTGQ